MILANGARIGSGVIIAAFLYPRCDRTDYVYIGFMGRRDLSSQTGYISVCSSSGDILCEAAFDLTSNSDIITSEFRQDGVFCGTISATKDILAILRGRYYLKRDSLVFTPSVFHPTPVTNEVARLYYQGQYVDSITFSGGYISGGTVGEVTLGSQDVSNQLDPIKRINVTNGADTVIIGGTTVVCNKVHQVRHVNIVPKVKWSFIGTGTSMRYIPGAIRVVSGEHELKLGMSGDVR